MPDSFSPSGQPATPGPYPTAGQPGAAPLQPTGQVQRTPLPPTSATVPFPSPTVSQLRHRFEMPLIMLGVVLTVLVACLAILMILLDIPLDDITTGVLIGLAAPALAVWFIRYLYWNQISNSVEVTERQFPEVYAVYQSLLGPMGFTASEGIMSPPRLYITNGNGQINAFAAKCKVRKGYVVLYSDIVDIAYAHNDFGFLRFVLAHELGHIKCGHVNLWRNIIRPVTTVLRLSPSVTRAQEYTADRCALYYAPERAEQMIYLFAGKYRGAQVDLDEYFRSVADHGESIWMKLANFLADHAVGFRRMAAIRQAKLSGTWDVHGKML
ncbi:M48 family metallopeptidase [Corynebacterium choanae]|nr:M48 family metallopeptidase [Corynebacterium choanae]